MLGLAWKVAVLRFFPLHVYAILLSPAFQVIGGGPGVSITMEYLMAVDVLTAESRHVFEPLHLSPDRCEFPSANDLGGGASESPLFCAWVSRATLASLSPPSSRRDSCSQSRRGRRYSSPSSSFRWEYRSRVSSSPRRSKRKTPHRGSRVVLTAQSMQAARE